MVSVNLGFAFAEMLYEVMWREIVIWTREMLVLLKIGGFCFVLIVQPSYLCGNNEAYRDR